jgi:hypothetical protein
MAKMHDPSELSNEDAVACLRAIQEKLWPDGDRDHEWDAETLDEVADVLTEAGLAPE